MQTEFLKEFIVTAKYSNFRKAAEELHLSQPALSNHIAALEREIGFSLFDRNGSARLTPAGARFYTRAQQMLDLLESSIKEGKSLSGQSRPVRIQMLGQDDSTLNRLLASVKTAFTIVPMSLDQTLFASLKSGEADLLATPGITELAERDENIKRGNFAYLPIGKAKVSCIVSNKSPLAEKDSLDTEDFRNQEILLPFGKLYDWMELQSPANKKGFGINYVQDPSLPMGTDHVPLCDLGDRIMLNYRGAAHRSCENRDDLVAIDKLDGKSYEVEEYLVFRAEETSPNVLAFVEEVRALAGDEQADGSGARVG